MKDDNPNKKEIILMAPNLMIGDALHLGQRIRSLSEIYRVSIFTTPYPLPVFQFFLRNTQLKIHKVYQIRSEALDHFNPLGFQEVEDMSSFESLPPALQFQFKREDVYPLWTDPEHKINDIYSPLEKLDLVDCSTNPLILPDKFLAVQPSSRSWWKTCRPLYACKFPLPVVSIGWPTNDEEKRRERTIPGSIDGRTRQMSITAAIIKASTAMIGINSSMTRLAAMLDVPVMCLSYNERAWEDRRITKWTENGIDLIEPSTDDIERCMGCMIEDLGHADELQRCDGKECRKDL